MRKGIQDLKFGLIGAGRVGSYFALLLHRKRLKLIGVSDLVKSRAQRISRFFSLKKKNWTNRELAEEVDVLLCATPDDEVVKIYETVKNNLSPAAFFVHFSGSLSSRAFPKGTRVLSLHPIYPFPENKKLNCLFNQIPFALEGEEEALKFGARLMRAMGQKYLVVPTAKKETYHLACVFASNFLTTSLQIALSLGKGVIRDKLALLPLAFASLLNAFSDPTKRAFSGPIVRGDKATIKRHIKVLKENFPELVPLYKEFSRIIFQFVKDRIPITKREEIYRIIKSKK